VSVASSAFFRRRARRAAVRLVGCEFKWFRAWRVCVLICVVRKSVDVVSVVMRDFSEQRAMSSWEIRGVD
jgi:hypothetical protein